MKLSLCQIIIAICSTSLALGGIVKPDLLSSNANELESDASEACSFDNSKIPYYIPHRKDCTKFFICDNGILHLRSCQPGLHFSSTLKACDYPEVAGCDKGPLNKFKEKMIGDNSCPSTNPKYPVLLPDPEDCSRFYICNGGLRHPQKCQSGLHFNPKINACDYPKKAGCEKDNEEKPKGKLGEDSDVCPEENSKHPVLLPHPDDCGKFYICDSGTAHLKNCQSGLHFNPKIKACDFPKKAGCDAEVEEDPASDEITGNDSEDLCPASDSKHPVYLPHPEDCSKFYICSSGTANLKQCQSGLHFNPKVKACDFPQNAGCGKGNLEKPEGKIPVDDFALCPAENSKYPVYLPHPEDCNKFYICNSGTAHLKQCQPGLHFNLKVKACDYPNKAGCDTETQEKPLGKDTGDDLGCPAGNPKYPVLLPDPEDCSRFYICNGGLRHPQKCQSGLHFNPKINACDYPKKAGCEKEMSPMMTGAPSPFCPPVNGKTPVFFRHSTNCSVYYMCGNGLAYEFACPSRLHFNLRKKVCDYENVSGCQSSVF